MRTSFTHISGNHRWWLWHW